MTVGRDPAAPALPNTVPVGTFRPDIGSSVDSSTATRVPTGGGSILQTSVGSLNAAVIQDLPRFGTCIRYRVDKQSLALPLNISFWRYSGHFNFGRRSDRARRR